MKINHIFLNLGLIVLFLLLVFFVKFIRDNVFYSIMILFLIQLSVYWLVKQRYEKIDIYLILFLFASFIISRLIFKNLDQSTLTLRTSAILAFFLLNIVLLIGPWSRFSKSVQKLYYYRRHLGVTVFLLGSLHAFIIFPQYFNYSFEAALSSVFIFYGLSAFFILFWLAITSWDYLQKLVKPLSWKILHGILLGSYAAAAYYMYTLQKIFDEPTLIIL